VNKDNLLPLIIFWVLSYKSLSWFIIWYNYICPPQSLIKFVLVIWVTELCFSII
jgi:hypothetical protein